MRTGGLSTRRRSPSGSTSGWRNEGPWQFRGGGSRRRRCSGRITTCPSEATNWLPHANRAVGGGDAHLGPDRRGMQVQASQDGVGFLVFAQNILSEEYVSLQLKDYKIHFSQFYPIHRKELPVYEKIG